MQTRQNFISNPLTSSIETKDKIFTKIALDDEKGNKVISEKQLSVDKKTTFRGNHNINNFHLINEKKNEDEILSTRSNNTGRKSNFKEKFSNKELVEITSIRAERESLDNNLNNQDLNENLLMKIKNFGSFLKNSGTNIENLLECNKNDIIKLNDRYNELNLKQKSKLSNEIKINIMNNEEIINDIYVNSDIRIDKYQLLFGFLTEKIKEINEFFKPKENDKNDLISSISITDKELLLTKQIISDFSSIISETNNLKNKRYSRKHTKEKSEVPMSLIKNISNYLNKSSDYCNDSEIQESVNINRPVNAVPSNKPNCFNAKFLPKNISTHKFSFDFDAHSMNTDFCGKGLIYEDEQLLNKLDLQLETTPRNKLFKIDSLTFNESQWNNFRENNFSLNKDDLNLNERSSSNNSHSTYKINYNIREYNKNIGNLNKSSDKTISQNLDTTKENLFLKFDKQNKKFLQPKKILEKITDEQMICYTDVNEKKSNNNQDEVKFHTPKSKNKDGCIIY